MHSLSLSERLSVQLVPSQQKANYVKFMWLCKPNIGKTVHLWW